MSELRPYQQQALADIKASIAGGVSRLVVQAATGAGKTRLAGAIVRGALEKRKRVAFCVPAISLVDQTVESFYAEGIRDIGVVQASHSMTDWSRPVQICSIQSIRSKKAFPDSDVVMFDEVHQFHETHRQWMDQPGWEKVPFLGLSATPWTKGLGKYFDSLLVVARTSDLIEQGYLSKFKVYATGHPDLSNVKVVAGDYQEKQLSEAMQAGELTADIVKTWQEKWGKGNTLCFGVDKAHAKNIQERFLHAGISCGYQDADTPADERRDIRRKFQSGELRVVSNIQTLTTGVDLDVRCLILARPTRSETLFVQIIGRALRTAPGKQEAIILDHSDTTMRLGFVTDIHHETLDDGKPKAKAVKKEPKLAMAKECEKCACLKPPKVRVCENCGHEDKILSMIMERDGQLVEFNLKQPKMAKAKAHEWTMLEKKEFYAELRAMARDRGYKEGWAANQYRERLKVWPDSSLKDVPPAVAVSPTTSLWIRSRQIAYAASQKNRQANAG